MGRWLMWHETPDLHEAQSAARDARRKDLYGGGATKTRIVKVVHPGIMWKDAGPGKTKYVYEVWVYTDFKKVRGVIHKIDYLAESRTAQSFRQYMASKARVRRVWEKGPRRRRR